MELITIESPKFHRWYDTVTLIQRVPLALLLMAVLGVISLLFLVSAKPLKPLGIVVSVGVAIYGEFAILQRVFTLGISLLLAGTVVAAVLTTAPYRFFTPGKRLVRERNSLLAVFIIIVVVASLTRFFRIDAFEQRLCYSQDSTIDVAFKGEWAMDFLKGRAYTPFILHWGERETLYIYLEAVLIWLFGQNLMSLTLLSILSGIFTVMFAVWLGSRLFGFENGLMTAYLLALSPWLIATNRISERFNFVPLFTVLAMTALLKALQDKKFPDFLTAGFLLGLGFYTFPSYRVVPGIAGVGCILWLLYEKGQRVKLLLGYVGYWIMTAVIALAPLQFSIKSFIDHFVFAKEHGFKMYKHAEDVTVYLKRLLGFFHYRFNGDMSYMSERPLIHPLLAVFLLIGLFLVLKQIYRKESLWLISWLGISYLPVIVSDPVPRRMGVTLPVVYLLTALGIMTILKRLTKDFAVLARSTVWGVSTLLVSGIGVHDLLRLHTKDYNVYDTRKCDLYRMEEYVRAVGPYFATYTTHMGEYQQLLRYYMHSKQDDKNDYEAQTVLPMDQIPLHKLINQDVLLVIGPQAHFQRSLPLYREYYPEAMVVNHPDDAGKIMFTSMFIPLSSILNNQGLLFSYLTPEGNWTEPVIERTLGFPEGIPEELPIPLTAKLSGSLYVPNSGMVQLKVEGTIEWSLSIDGTLIAHHQRDEEAAKTELFLFKGMHNLSLTLNAASRDATFQPLLYFREMGFRALPVEYLMPYPAKDNELRAPAWKASPIQFAPSATIAIPSPFSDEKFVPRRMTVDKEGRIFAADPEHITVVRFDQQSGEILAFKPLDQEVTTWSKPIPFSGERHREMLLRITRQQELLIADQSRNILHCFDLDGNRLWQTDQIGGYFQAIITGWRDDDAVWFLAGGRPWLLDRGQKKVVQVEGWDQYLFGYYEVNAMAVDYEEETMSFYDGAYEVILTYTINGEFLRAINNLSRHDNTRMETLPEGIRIFTGLRSFNIYAFSRDGDCLIGSHGDLPLNIVAHNQFDMISDLAVTLTGDSIYLLYYNSWIQVFNRVRG